MEKYNRLMNVSDFNKLIQFIKECDEIIKGHNEKINESNRKRRALVIRASKLLDLTHDQVNLIAIDQKNILLESIIQDMVIRAHNSIENDKKTPNPNDSINTNYNINLNDTQNELNNTNQNNSINTNINPNLNDSQNESIKSNHLDDLLIIDKLTQFEESITALSVKVSRIAINPTKKLRLNL